MIAPTTNPSTESASSQEVKALREAAEELLAPFIEADRWKPVAKAKPLGVPNSCSCCGRPTKQDGYCGRCLDF